MIDAAIVKGLKSQLLKVRKAVDTEIANNSDRGSLYARGLAGEGFLGGYRAAIDDVILAINGNVPNRDWWSTI